ncbi:hypothetical protein PMAYCL1PPCAC_31603, partial [Pristionchus mayeri]
ELRCTARLIYFSKMRTSLCSLLFAYLLSVSYCRVTFTLSEVLQESDLDDKSTAPFKCANGCQIYSDSASDEMWINDGYKDVQNFLIFGSKDGTVASLVKSNDYKLVYRGNGTSPKFVFYVVDKTAPNINTKVISANGEPSYLSYSEAIGMFTLLRSFDPITSIVFDGNFTDGYPRIYTTGFDATSEAACSPVYVSRSEENALNSKITIPSPILTVMNGPPLAMSDPNYQPSGTFENHAEHSSAVYISPGYVGCSYVKDQMYSYSAQSVHDSFSAAVSSVDLEAKTSLPEDPNEALNIVVNKRKIQLTGSMLLKTNYEADQFDISIDWTRKTLNSSFLVKFDLGAASDPTSSATSSVQKSTTTSSAHPTTSTTTTSAVPPTTSMTTDVMLTISSLI